MQEEQFELLRRKFVQNRYDKETLLVIADYWTQNGTPLEQLQGQLILTEHAYQEDKKREDLLAQAAELRTKIATITPITKEKKGRLLMIKEGYVVGVEIQMLLKRDIQWWKTNQDVFQQLMLACLPRYLFAKIRHADALPTLADFPCSELVKQLNLAKNKIGYREIEAIVESPYLKNLEYLNLAENQLGKAEAALLSRSPNLKHLTELEIQGNPIGNNGLEHLVQSPHINHLTKIQLGNCALNNKGAILIANSPKFQYLTSLTLYNNSIGDKGAKTLADSPYLKNLKYLELGRNPLGEIGKKAILSSEILRDCQKSFSG
jgi:hypothetical protein